MSAAAAAAAAHPFAGAAALMCAEYGGSSIQSSTCTSFDDEREFGRCRRSLSTSSAGGVLSTRLLPTDGRRSSQLSPELRFHDVLHRVKLSVDIILCIHGNQMRLRTLAWYTDGSKKSMLAMYCDMQAIFLNTVFPL